MINKKLKENDIMRMTSLDCLVESDYKEDRLEELMRRGYSFSRALEKLDEESQFWDYDYFEEEY
jgi:hypothetical protein